MTDLAISGDSPSFEILHLNSLEEGYEILSQIGTGGAADVYAGRDRLGNLIAIKRMLPPQELELYDASAPTEKLSITPGIIRTFFDEDGISLGAKKEWTIGQELRHPHLMEVKHLIATNKGTFLILELIDGKDLSHLKPGDLTSAEAKKYALDLLDVLIYAYRRGYFYADLCPRNVMITNKGMLKLIDLEGFEKIEEGSGDYFPLLYDCINHLLAIGQLQLKPISTEVTLIALLETFYQKISEGHFEVKLSSPENVGVLGKV